MEQTTLSDGEEMIVPPPAPACGMNGCPIDATMRLTIKKKGLVHNPHIDLCRAHWERATKDADPEDYTSCSLQEIADMKKREGK